MDRGLIYAVLKLSFSKQYKIVSILYGMESIFVSGDQGYFKLGVLLEGSRPLMSSKLAPHVFVTFTEQVVPIHKHEFILNSVDVSNKKVTMKLTKNAAVKLFDHTPITYLLSALCNCVAVTWQQTFTSSCGSRRLAACDFWRHLWHVMQRDSDCWLQ